MHTSGLNRLDNGMILTTRAKLGMITENYNAIDDVNLRAEAKRFTQTMQK